jgi:DNA repair exonuclease SbcCD ATPase subunit
MPPRCRTAEKMLDPSEKVWSTLRCLEYQLEAHEARFHRDGDVNWQAIRHMIMAAQQEARTTGAALRRAWTDEDAVGDDLAQTKLQLRETEQELQRLRRVHMEFQSEELQAARSEIVELRKQQDRTQAENAGLTEDHRLLKNLAKSVRQTCQMVVTDREFVQLVASALHQYDALYSMLLSQNTSFAATESTNSQTTPNSHPAPVTEPLDDSSGADGPGQS